MGLYQVCHPLWVVMSSSKMYNLLIVRVSILCIKNLLINCVIVNFVQQMYGLLIV
jgi:hypothetical protein